MKLSPNNEENGSNLPQGPRYWRSLHQLSDEPEFKEWLHREFPAGASEVEGVNRRRFLQIMASSFALAGAGMAGCRRPEAHIRPYSKAPERIVPGVPVNYATSLPMARETIPLVVETHQNRPIKVEGNPKYQPFGGATNLHAQASILDLYDPDRSVNHYSGSKGRLSLAAVNDLLASVNSKFAPTGGQGLAFLAEPSTSVTRSRLLGQLQQAFPRMLWAEHDAAGQDNLERAARELFGAPIRPIYRFDRARRILSIDCDFVGREPGHLGYARAFTTSRKVFSPEEAGKMSRLYIAESAYSLTGTMADHRLRLPSSHAAAFAALVLAETLEQTQGDAQFAGVLRQQAAGLQVDAAWVRECVTDLLQNPGQALVVGGSHLPVEAHVAIFYINQLLGSFGQTLRMLQISEPSQAATLGQLAQAIQQGAVETLVILGGNPVYATPGDLDFQGLLAKVPNIIRLGYRFDETSLAVTERGGVHISETHYLETWNDGRTFDGVLTPVQPMIMPLFQGLSDIELLAKLAGVQETDPYALVLETFKTIVREGDVAKAFDRFLYNGYLQDSGFAEARVNFGAGQAKTIISRSAAAIQNLSANALEVRILPDYKLLDGRYANNGWLQECPEPISKLTWDNAIWISPKLAQELNFSPEQQRLMDIASAKTGEFVRGAEHAPVATIQVNGRSITGPIQIQPGLADYTVAVTLGYGRTKVGRIGNQVGYNAYPATTLQNKAFATGASLSLNNETYRLANTQEHWSLEGRAIVREANLDTFEHEPDFASHMGMEAHSPAVYGSQAKAPLQLKVTEQPRGNSSYEIPTFTKPKPNVDVWNQPGAEDRFPKPQQWGMAIDMNTCIGCSACVVACQSENNIPIVGKDQVIRGREMHWLRIDRYYSAGELGSAVSEIPADPQVSWQPMACVHCERAPCEQVCPVNATVHDEQGLNVMAYNRCVGTRYCSNNCPYKVRRFNFFDWNKREAGSYYQGPLGPNEYTKDGLLSELPKMQKNPDVTVRMRGVMEKCTYCVQRIQRAKISQRVKAAQDPDTPDDAIRIPDGILQTACQQACPTDAIEFGDVSDPNSLVSILKSSPRDYAVLGYLNTRPRTTYLARLRNPNPRMPDYAEMPLSALEYQSKNAGAGHGGSHKEPEAAHSGTGGSEAIPHGNNH